MSFYSLSKLSKTKVEILRSSDDQKLQNFTDFQLAVRQLITRLNIQIDTIENR